MEREVIEMQWQLRTIMMFAFMTGLLVVIGLVAGALLGNMWMGMWVMLGFSVLINIVSLFASKKMALSAHKVHLVTRAEEPVLYDVVERLANKAGLPMPEVGVSEMQIPNAFATGRGPKDAAVVATRPLLNMLTEEELEGVMAHELSHVKNRDILVMSVASTLASVIAFVTRMAVYSAIFNNDEDNGANLALVLLMDITMPIAAMLIQLGVSRSREYLADESGARLTGKPMALASALTRLEGGCTARGNTYNSDATANMWITNPRGKSALSGLQNLFRTHPTTEDRIARLRKLDAELNGRY